MPERTAVLIVRLCFAFSLRPRLIIWNIDTEIMAKIILEPPGRWYPVLFLMLRRLWASSHIPNERQQAGIGLVIDRVGLRLINVLDSKYFSAEVACFDHLGFGFVTK